MKEFKLLMVVETGYVKCDHKEMIIVEAETIEEAKKAAEKELIQYRNEVIDCYITDDFDVTDYE